MYVFFFSISLDQVLKYSKFFSISVPVLVKIERNLEDYFGFGYGSRSESVFRIQVVKLDLDFRARIRPSYFYHGAWLSKTKYPKELERYLRGVV